MLLRAILLLRRTVRVLWTILLWRAIVWIRLRSRSFGCRSILGLRGSIGSGICHSWFFLLLFLFALLAIETGKAVLSNNVFVIELLHHFRQFFLAEQYIGLFAVFVHLHDVLYTRNRNGNKCPRIVGVGIVHHTLKDVGFLVESTGFLGFQARCSFWEIL